MCILIIFWTPKLQMFSYTAGWIFHVFRADWFCRLLLI